MERLITINLAVVTILNVYKGYSERVLLRRLVLITIFVFSPCFFNLPVDGSLFEHGNLRK